MNREKELMKLKKSELTIMVINLESQVEFLKNSFGNEISDANEDIEVHNQALTNLTHRIARSTRKIDTDNPLSALIEVSAIIGQVTAEIPKMEMLRLDSDFCKEDDINIGNSYGGSTTGCWIDEEEE